MVTGNSMGKFYGVSLFSEGWVTEPPISIPNYKRLLAILVKEADPNLLLLSLLSTLPNERFIT